MSSSWLIVIALFRFPCPGISLGNIAISSALPTAFENVTRHLFQLETRMFINNYGVDSNTLTWLLLRNLNEKAMPFQLQNLEPETERVFINSSTLFTFNSFATFRAFNQKLSLTNEYYKPMQLFVFCHAATIIDIKSLVKDLEVKANNNYMMIRGSHGEARVNTALEDHIQYEYFLIEETNCVKLMTFVWFAPRKCGKLVLMEINRFSKSTAKWQSDEFSIRKLANFHGCDIVHLFDAAQSGSLLHWFIPEMLKTELNYNLRLWSYNGDTSNLLHVVFRQGCLNAFDKYHKFERLTPSTYSNISFLTSFVEFSPVRMAVPPTDNISEYAKLALPFDNYVWALIFLTFVIAFGAILVLYCVKRQIRDVVIGSNVSTPSLNVSQIFFGISQVAVPRGSFARFLAISFILYSLIIRTAWQGKMFEFMQKNITKPELQTVEEMIGKGYTFYMEPYFKKKFPETEIAKRSKIKTFEVGPEREIFAKLVMDKDFKGVIQMDLGIFSEMNLWTNGRCLQRIRKEILYVNICGMKFPHHHHFTEIFDFKSQQLFTGGITQLHSSLVHQYSDPNRYKHLYQDEPQQLTMKKLEPGFVIWIASFSLAIVALIFEWLTTIKDYMFVKYIFTAFYSTRFESEYCIRHSRVKRFLRVESVDLEQV